MAGSEAAPRRLVKTYGRGSLLGLLSVPFACVMARLGMHGWADAAAREMEDDAVAMARRGCRVVDSRELGWPQLGVTYFEVTYERGGPDASEPT